MLKLKEIYSQGLLLLILLASCRVTSTSFPPYAFAVRNFTSSFGSSVSRLSLESGPLLIHSRAEEEEGIDVIKFVGTRDEAELTHTVQLHTPLYYNLMAVSHLPVTVVVDLAPDISSPRPSTHSDRDTSRGSAEAYALSNTTIQSLNQTLRVVKQVGQLITTDEFPNPGQVERQMLIINKTIDFIQRVTRAASVSVEDLENYIISVDEELKQNAYDSVADYLQSLNRTITELLDNNTITSEDFGNLSVIIDLPPFTKPNSFIVQYYEQLLGYNYGMDTARPNRIFLLPATIQNSTIDATINAFSSAKLSRIITGTFYTQNLVFSSTHLYLCQAAEEIICSPLLSFLTCAENRGGEEELPPGFANRTERAYVSAIVFLCGTCTVLVIITACVFREGKIMRRERRSENPLLPPPPPQMGKTSTNRHHDRDDGDGLEEDGRGGGGGGGGGGRDEIREERNGLVTETPLLNFPSTNKRRRGLLKTALPTARERPSITYSEVSVINNQ